jgi:hypothetical protein
MTLRMELADQLLASPPHLSLEVGSDDWRVYVLGVFRIGADTFVQLALVGPRFCTVMTRVRAALDADSKAHEIVILVRDWLTSGTRATQAFLESRECASVPV